MGLEKREVSEKNDLVSSKEGISSRILAREGYQVSEIINDCRTFLGLKDGGYDEIFVNKLKQFQIKVGFSNKYVDGILGTSTLKKIIENDNNYIIGKSDWSNRSLVDNYRKSIGIKPSIDEIEFLKPKIEKDGVWFDYENTYLLEKVVPRDVLKNNLKGENMLDLELGNINNNDNSSSKSSE